MKKITPSERISKEIKELMSGANGTENGDGLLPQFTRLAMQRLLQELLEGEQADFLGREHYEHKSGASGWRNGYEPGTLKTSEGKVPVELPQVRNSQEPFRSRLWAQMGKRTDVLERLAVELYARGLSTRDIEDAFESATGERLLSRSTVSEVTDSLWAEYEAFQQRDLSGFELECLFLDAVYESLRFQAGAKEGVLCAWGILRDGRKVLLHMALGNSESLEAWLGTLRNMVERGLRIPLSVTSDGAPGLIAAIERAYPKSLRIHCWAHKMRNIEAKLPKETVTQVRADIYTIRDAATFEQGQARAAEVITRYEDSYPSAMASLKRDLTASLTHLKLPARLRQVVRTTNLLERTFVEERRRTKIIPRFFNEKSCLKLVYAVLWRASQHWARIRFNETELEQLSALRRVLQLPPGKEQPTPSTDPLVSAA